MLGRILTANVRDKNFSVSFIVYQSVNVVVALSGKAYYCETWITYSSLTRHATQQTPRHDTPNKNIVSTYKVESLGSVSSSCPVFQSFSNICKKNIKVLGN